jgi:hypothetical protein
MGTRCEEEDVGTRFEVVGNDEGESGLAVCVGFNDARSKDSFSVAVPVTYPKSISDEWKQTLRVGTHRRIGGLLDVRS